MTTDIFIRTCAKDAAWLQFAVKSIRERVTGYRDLVITCPRAAVEKVKRATGQHVIGIDPFHDYYVGQQHTKLKATDHSDADVICFWDSDTVAAEPVDLNDLLFSGGRLIVHHVPFDGLADGSEVWRKTMTKTMGSVPDFEFMRRLPLAYYRSTLLGCVQHIERTHGMPLSTYMKRVPQRQFTEFNCIGMWAYENERSLYDFRIDEGEAAEWKRRVRQFWSWCGITPEVVEELHKLGLA